MESAQAFQFWPASGLKGMPNTQIYDKEGREKYLETNPAEILARNQLFKPPPKWEEALFQGLVPGRINFFLLPKPFSENSRKADSKNAQL